MSVVVNSLADLEEWQASQRPPEPTKACTKCQTEYPISHFRRTNSGRPWSRCETCREPNRRAASAEQVRRSNLKRLYGITPEMYDALRLAQAFRCAICRRHEDELVAVRTGRPRLDGTPGAEPMKLHVDHDHDTDEIRGLLCAYCNAGLGQFQDRVDWMQNAINYLNAKGDL